MLCRYGAAVDVYSFGIILWELATRSTQWADLAGEAPEADAMRDFLLLNSALQTGRRPEVPVEVIAAQSGFVDVMQACWAGDPADRPPFSKASAALAACLRVAAASSAAAAVALLG